MIDLRVLSSRFEPTAKARSTGHRDDSKVEAAGSDEGTNMRRLLTSVILTVLTTLIPREQTTAQQVAPPPVMQAAPPPGDKSSSPTPPVLQAEQVTPIEMTGLVGHAVLGKGGIKLGRIVDLLVDGRGNVRAVVIDVGGFMGVGNRLIAVAWSALQFAVGEKGPEVFVTISPDRLRSWADYIVGRPIAILGAPAREQ